MQEIPWFPCSPFERLENCVFLPRMLDKARRKESGLPIGEYMYGDNDYMDSRLLRFLRASAAEVSALVRSQPGDDIVARMLIERSGKTPGQIAWFNNRMLLAYGVIFAMFDADEGRRSGPLARALAHFYNLVIYPPFAWKFARDETRVSKTR